ncbi:PhzF family phenazine biosynthesis protein [Pseudomonas benzenivorans]|uniref:PhzF family phenazine biosynthesis protein n=1 Tax=Pseudomonas benzenivorans TaxID=556533 RepID=A0ABY5H4P2_9PSED|nr:PhzF family phenazine biosynthesis protein [Pseudomonas benzenivorans]UTW06618.1 PhzF family phenazine biosynthesis protein [Pseudomonas benzenivorans]
MHYWQLDVFAEQPLTGNGLAVFPDARTLSATAMQRLTQELRQFESIFLLPGHGTGQFEARIFTAEEELPFAGHPIIGAAALLHHLHAPAELAELAEWTLQLSAKSVHVTTRRHGPGFYAEMDQGQAEFGQRLDTAAARTVADAFGLADDQLDLRYPPTVVSTGLPYLLLPVTAAGLARAKQRRLLDPELRACGAAFVFLLDVDNREGRTWDPAGVIEDVATGSAAGPVAAYLVEQGLHARGEAFRLNQGRFLHRPSTLEVCVGVEGRVRVGGHVQLLARAELLVAPTALG